MPGKIERTIAAAFAEDPDGAFTAEDIALRVYPDIDRPEKKHRVAVLRAMKRFVARHPRWGIYEWTVPAIHDRTSAAGTELARGKADALHGYCLHLWHSNAFQEDGDWTWVRRREALERRERLLRENLDPSQADRAVARAKAELAGDLETLARMDREAEEESARREKALQESLRRWKGEPDPKEQARVLASRLAAALRELGAPGLQLTDEDGNPVIEVKLFPHMQTETGKQNPEESGARV